MAENKTSAVLEKGSTGAALTSSEEPQQLKVDFSSWIGQENIAQDVSTADPKLTLAKLLAENAALKKKLNHLERDKARHEALIAASKAEQCPKANKETENANKHCLEHNKACHEAQIATSKAEQHPKADTETENANKMRRHKRLRPEQRFVPNLIK